MIKNKKSSTKAIL